MTSDLRDCRKFSDKKILSGLFPVFTRQIARYPPRKNRKTSSKETPKPDPSKIQMSSYNYNNKSNKNVYTKK